MSQKFLGYVIVKKSDGYFVEQIALLKENAAIVYNPEVSKARRFNDVNIAYQVAKNIGDGLKVCRLYETDTHYGLGALNHDDAFTIVKASWGVDRKNKIHRLEC